MISDSMPDNPKVSLIRREMRRMNSSSWYDFVSRSMFDVDPKTATKSMLHGDRMLPFLASNALRERLRSQASWQTCVRFTTEQVDQYNADEIGYIENAVNNTRNTRRYDNLRNQVGAVLLSPGNLDPSASQGILSRTDYGMRWAYERNQYERVNLIGKYVITIVAANEFNAAVVPVDIAPMDRELVQPSLLLNSSIRQVLIGYNLAPHDNDFELSAQHVLLKQDDPKDSCVSIWTPRPYQRHSTARNLCESELDEIGQITLKSTGEIAIESDILKRELQSLLTYSQTYQE